MRITRLKESGSDMPKIILACVLIALAVFSRVIMPYPPNFAPIAAIAIFAGAVLPRNWALSLPLVAMIASDLFIGLHSLVLFTWGSFVLIAFLSSRYLKKIRPLSIIGASLGASALFFVVSNFGVWAEGWLYSRTLAGLVQAYVNAIPFFRNTLLGDMTFTVAIFTVYAIACRFVLPKLGAAETPAH